MSTEQLKVKEFIKHDRTLTAGKNIYNSLRNKSMAMQQVFNRMNNQERDIKTLCYELCKAVGLSSQQYAVLINQPVCPLITDEDTSSKSEVEAQDDTDSKLHLDLVHLKVNDLDYRAMKKLAAQYSEDLDIDKPIDQKKDTLISYLENLQNIQLEKIAAEVPLNVKQGISLREQFPFLKDKECPDELKVLVADLITARENYVNGHQRLFDKITKEQEAALAQDIVGNFIENKMAFAELEHYREHGVILGEHPAVKKVALGRELAALSTAELTKKVNSLRKNISTNNSKAEQFSKESDDRIGYEEKVADYEWQLDQVQELLKLR